MINALNSLTEVATSITQQTLQSESKEAANFDKEKEAKFIHSLQDISQQPMEEVAAFKEYAVYFFTNEKRTTEVREEIIKTEKISNGVFFGVACVSTMQLIPISQARFAILFDCSEQTVKFNKFVVNLLKVSSHKDTMEAIRKYIKESESCFKWSLVEKEMNTQFFNEEEYQYLANMAKEDRIVCIQGDLFNTKIIQKITQCVAEHSFHFSFVYLSNVFGYYKRFLPSKVASLVKNFQLLIEDRTLVVDAMFKSRAWNRHLYLGNDRRLQQYFEKIVNRGQTD